MTVTATLQIWLRDVVDVFCGVACAVIVSGWWVVSLVIGEIRVALVEVYIAFV